ncbi:hypothetical protein [Brevibacillus sp. H7]|uniref:hypothetical protein n=1 Tax=Brevibacillus sp. H7 TaxID=3349138 RepID=UPI0038189C42
MFHPIVFDNIKVVLEGAVYDRDFEGAVTVTGRSDVMDLATFHRQFQIEFGLADEINSRDAVKATIQLKTSLADIASEQLEQTITDHVGCTICIHFSLLIRDVKRETEAIIAIVNDIWGHRPHIAQLVKSRLDEHRLTWPPERYENQVTLDFHRKIDEGNIEDMRRLVDHCIQTLVQLQEFQRS